MKKKLFSVSCCSKLKQTAGPIKDGPKIISPSWEIMAAIFYSALILHLKDQIIDQLIQKLISR